MEDMILAPVSAMNTVETVQKIISSFTKNINLNTDKKPKYNIIGKDQKSFLESRYSVFHKYFNELINTVFPNTFIVALPWGDPELPMLLSSKTIHIEIPEKIIMKKMRDSECHDNVDKLFAKKKIKQKVTGYGLSKDGLWRQHSWGKDNDGNIVETTESRIAYLSGIDSFDDK